MLEAAACGSPRAGDTAAMREVSCGAKSPRVTQMVTRSLLEIRLLVCSVSILVQGRFAFVRPSFCCECSHSLGARTWREQDGCASGDASIGLWAAAAHFPPLTLLVLVLMSCRPVECVNSWPLLEVATENNLSGDLMELVRKPSLWLRNMFILPQTVFQMNL